jgi:cytoskeleton protein RodZ
LKAGEGWPVPNEPGITLTTGNAGGTIIVRNGHAGPPLGPPGVVLRHVLLTGVQKPAATGQVSPPAILTNSIRTPTSPASAVPVGTRVPLPKTSVSGQ